MLIITGPATYYSLGHSAVCCPVQYFLPVYTRNVPEVASPVTVNIDSHSVSFCPDCSVCYVEWTVSTAYLSITDVNK